MKKAISAMLAIALLFTLMSMAIADNSIYAVLLKQLRKGMPLQAQKCQFGEDLNGRITIDYFFESDFDDTKMLSYILHAQEICRPEIETKVVSYVHFRHYDEYTIKDDFAYETNGAKLGKVVDSRYGKKKTTKFENIIDVYLYCPQEIPEDAEAGEELELIQKFVEYVEGNPKLKSKKLADGFAKELGAKSAEILELLQQAMYKVYVYR